MRATDQKQNHTASYYAATANDVTHYPALEGSQSADICVVGGGFDHWVNLGYEVEK